MEFPTFIYRCPGPHWGPHGTTYEAVDVADEAAFESALREGWFASLQEAAETAAGIRDAQVPADDDAPPTRAEMEAKAIELGIKFDGRTTDARLLAKIIDALKASNQE
jgi:hypothetical protein